MRIFPPNTDPQPGDDRAKLHFHGSLLITKYFERVEDGRELIKIVGGKSGFGRATVDNPSNAGFGSNFEFHFLEDPNGAYSGLTFNADKYRLYDIDGEGHVYLYCLNNTGKLVWRKKQTKVEDAVLLVFDFSSTDGGSASSMSRIRSHFTQLVRTQHSCSEKTASAESFTLDSYLQYCGIAQPSSSVKVETLLSLLMGPETPDMLQFTSLKGLPLEMQSLIDNALTWTMEEATTISVTNEKVVRCAVLPSTAPTFADGNTSAENTVRNREP